MILLILNNINMLRIFTLLLLLNSTVSAQNIHSYLFVDQSKPNTSNSFLVGDTVNSQPYYSFGTKVNGIRQPTFKEEWVNNDNTVWASLANTQPSKEVSFSLITSNALSGTTGTGAFIVKTNDSNSFSLSANSYGGTIGWENVLNTKIFLAAETIETNAVFKTTGSITVYGADESGAISIPENILGYFSSNESGRTGLLIKNSNIGAASTAAITLQQGSYTNWLGTYSANSTSNLYLPGSFVVESNSPNGILLSASSSNDGSYGSIRFAVNSSIAATISATSFLIGTASEFTSSILTVSSDSRGVLFPRLTSKQIQNINDPIEGLFLYDKTRKKYTFFNGKCWEEMCSKPIIDL